MEQGVMPLLQSNKLINPSLIIATCTQRILLNIKRYKVGKNQSIYEEQKLQRCRYMMYYFNYIS